MGLTPCAASCSATSAKTQTARRKQSSNVPKGTRRTGIPAIEVDTELFVGGRRVFEREAGGEAPEELGFIAGSNVERARACLRVRNLSRRGWCRPRRRSHGLRSRRLGAHGAAAGPREPTGRRRGQRDRRRRTGADAQEGRAESRWRRSRATETRRSRKRSRLTRRQIERARCDEKPLERLLSKHDPADVSTGALRELRLNAEVDADLRAILDAATTPAPLRPALSRALVDAWSMTSLKEHTGRPEIDPWLRGWVRRRSAADGRRLANTSAGARRGEAHRPEGRSKRSSRPHAARERSAGDRDLPRRRVACRARESAWLQHREVERR